MKDKIERMKSLGAHDADLQAQKKIDELSHLVLERLMHKEEFDMKASKAAASCGQLLDLWQCHTSRMTISSKVSSMARSEPNLKSDDFPRGLFVL